MQWNLITIASLINGTQIITDGCLIPISTPTWAKTQEARKKFFCRKYFYAWNCLGICDHENRFIWFSCQAPGATHDSVIYYTSKVRAKIEATFDYDSPRFFLGDKGYRNERSMIVPIRENSVKTRAQKLFNTALSKARIVIEHSYGIFKKTWPIFLYKVRKYNCSNSQCTILAGVVLHNIARNLREEVPPLPSTMSLERFDQLMSVQKDQATTNVEHNSFIRNSIIANYFSWLMNKKYESFYRLLVQLNACIKKAQFTVQIGNSSFIVANKNNCNFQSHLNSF